MKEFSWWTGTANHLWRAYFVLLQYGMNDQTPADSKIYNLCDAVYNRLTFQEQEIVRMYYTCRWGDNIYAVEDYSARTGIPVLDIYNAIRTAGYAVINELGIINPNRNRKR